MSNTSETPSRQPAPFRDFALAATVLILAYALPLWHLVRFAAGDDLQSYILLIPAISGYLVWLQRHDLPPRSTPAIGSAVAFFAAGLAAILWHWSRLRLNHATAGGDGLGWTTFSFLAMLTGAGCLCLGGARMRALAFPFAFLILAIPMPDGLRLGLETALQHGSAEVAAAMFQLVGTPLMRDGMIMRLPGMNIEVAPECSGIHSTLVLFITSILAGHLILRGPWRRTVLCLAVIPLALLRNGFRILVIGELCVHVGPQMIDSPIHHHGGPLFFALSLVPFFLLLYYLRKPGRPAAAAGSLPIPK